jgi:hypothetical protein
VYIYADWCQFCERLKPVWFELGAALAGPGGVATGRVNGPEQRALSTRLAVRGYPTILLFREGTMRTYPATGARSAGALQRWAREGYAGTPPAPYHRTPNNALGRAVGRLFALPAAAAAARARAQAAWGLSDGALAAACAAAALAAAAAAVAGLDLALALSTRRAARPHAD